MAKHDSSVVFTVLVLAILGAAGWMFLGSGENGRMSPTATGTDETPAAAADPRASSALTTEGPVAPTAAAAGHGARTAVASAPAPTSVFRLRGRLLTAQQVPVADVEVGFAEAAVTEVAGTPVDVRELADPALAPSDKARSGPDGRFDLTLTAGRSGRLRLVGDAWYVRGGGAGAQPTPTLEVSALTADRDLGDIVIGRTARLAGVVRDAAERHGVEAPAWAKPATAAPEPPAAPAPAATPPADGGGCAMSPAVSSSRAGGLGAMLLGLLAFACTSRRVARQKSK